MPSIESKEETLVEIFNDVAQALKTGLRNPDGVAPAMIEVALKFLKQNGEVSQLPVPGSKVSEIRDSLPFKSARQV